MFSFMRFDNINRNFGDVVKKRRMDIRLSQKDFGERVGLSRASVANIERGAQGVNLQQLYEFANNLNTTPENLLPKYQYNELKKFSKQTRSWIEDIIKEA